MIFLTKFPCYSPAYNDLSPQTMYLSHGRKKAPKQSPDEPCFFCSPDVWVLSSLILYFLECLYHFYFYKVWQFPLPQIGKRPAVYSHPYYSMRFPVTPLGIINHPLIINQTHQITIIENILFRIKPEFAFCDPFSGNQMMICISPATSPGKIHRVPAGTGDQLTLLANSASISA